MLNRVKTEYDALHGVKTDYDEQSGIIRGVFCIDTGFVNSGFEIGSGESRIDIGS